MIATLNCQNGSTVNLIIGDDFSVLFCCERK